jgi:regulator of sigma E protease
MDIFQLLTSSVWSILMIALFFGGSIFVHELGHFWVAKKRGVKVDRFSIGFGPAIFKWTGKDGVEYRLSWLPLGGYVALPQLADMRGLEGEPNAEVAALPSPNYTTRMLVFGAGAFMNVVFAFALATILWQVGMPTNADMQRAKIGHVLPEVELPDGSKVASPAASAGLRVGDTITAIDGNVVTTWDEMRQMLFTGAGRDAEGRPLAALTVRRGDETVTLSARPVLAGDEGMRMLGVAPFEQLKVGRTEPGSPAEKAGLLPGDLLLTLNGVALTSGQFYVTGLRAAPEKPSELVVERGGQKVTLTVPPRAKAKEPAELGIEFAPEIVMLHRSPWAQITDNVKMTFRTLGSLLNRDSDIGISKLSGPIGIARVFHITAQEGIRYVLWFTIIVNVNLAIFNLLPLPVLDGGHMLFATIGKLRGKALPARFIQTAQSVFVAALLSMMLYVSFFDVRRIARDAKADEPAKKTESSDAPSGPAAQPESLPAVVPVK